MDIGGWDAGVGEDALHAIPVQLFAKHVIDLHMNQEVGFAKEYEEIRAASCLEEFAAARSAWRWDHEAVQIAHILKMLVCVTCLVISLVTIFWFVS